MFWPRTNPYLFVGRDGAGFLEDSSPTFPGLAVRRRTQRRAAEGPALGEGPGPFGALTPLLLARLNAVQGRREARLLTLDDLAEVVGVVRAGRPWHFDGGAFDLGWVFSHTSAKSSLFQVAS